MPGIFRNLVNALRRFSGVNNSCVDNTKSISHMKWKRESRSYPKMRKTVAFVRKCMQRYKKRRHCRSSSPYCRNCKHVSWKMKLWKCADNWYESILEKIHVALQCTRSGAFEYLCADTKEFSLRRVQPKVLADLLTWFDPCTAED